MNIMMIFSRTSGLSVAMAVSIVCTCGNAFAQITVPPPPKASAAAESEPLMLRGNDRVIATPQKAYQLEGSPISFRFEDAPIADVIALVLRDIMKVDYVLYPPIVGSVTLATRGDVAPDSAVALLETALLANGVAMVRDGRGVFHIGRPESLKGVVGAVRQMGGGGSPIPPGQGTVIFSLQYISATEMASILRPLVPAEAIVRVDTVRNILVMQGSRSQAEGWLDLIGTFDVNMLAGMSVAVLPLKYLSTKDIEAAIQLMVPGTAAASTRPTTAPPTTPGTTPTPSPGVNVDGGGFLGGVRILPIERINSIMVVAPRAALVEQAREWIARLDKPNAGNTESQLFIYGVQNGSAKHLASLLGSLFGSGASSAATPQRTGVAPSLASATASTTGFGATAGLGQSNANQAAQPSVTAVNVGSGVRVIADELNNAILVYGSQSEYNKIETALKRLDVSLTQVLIEASIIEVTLSEDLEYGLQWFFNDKARGAGSFSGTGVIGGGTLNTAGTGLAASATSKGFSYTLSNPLGIRAALTALATKSLVKVISSPNLMVLDNHTASIVVGTQQPVSTGTTSIPNGTTATTVSSYQYKDTGVQLTVTPSVNAGNVVTMQINQQVTDIGDNNNPTQQQAFLQRQINSKVAVRSGEAIVLGGLIKENVTGGKTGVPFLQDIPLIGNLFGTNSKKTDRTELLVIITPHVVRSDQDIREISTDLRERMKGLKAFAPNPQSQHSPAQNP